MPPAKNEVPEPEGSPRSMFRKFFNTKENKNENDKLNDKKKTYENEFSQTTTIEEAENDENTEKKKQNIDSERNQKEKKKRLSSVEKEESIDEVPVKDSRKAIQDELDSTKLTTIINNSIKEAVRNIVKDGVCDFIESHEPKKSKKPKLEKLPEIKEDLTPRKDNSNKDKSTLLTTEEKKTFNSHPSRTTPGFHKSPERGPVTQCDRSICPAYVDEPEKLKRSKAKKTKQKTHFSTDNRRMTGNVNIYICSEANENVNHKSQEKEKVCDASESESEMKSSTSASSVSTTKLLDALKKKRKKKVNDQELECLCEEPEGTINDTEQSIKKLPEIPDEMSSMSRLNDLNDQISSTDYLDGCSLENCPALSANSFNYSPYDDYWEIPRSSLRNYSYLPAERDITPQESLKKDVCCACKKRKPALIPYSYEMGPELNSVATNFPENHEIFTFCTNEATEKYEKPTTSCRMRENKPNEEFTVCTNQPVKATEDFTVCCKTIETTNNEEDMKETSVENPDKNNEENAKSEPAISTSIEILAETNESAVEPISQTEKEVTEEKQEPTQSNETEIPPEDEKKESIIIRLWKKIVTLVRGSKPSPPITEIVPDVVQTPENPEKSQTSQTSQVKPEEQESLKTKSKSTSSLGTLQSGQTLRNERRLKSKIVSRISSRQKQKEATRSDSKIPSDTNPPSQIEVVPSPEDLEKPKEEVESPRAKINCECEYLRDQEPTSEEPKLVPCTFTSEKQPQDTEECVPIELSKCKCQKPKYELHEEKCCTCRLETSCCTCKPISSPPKTCKKSCRSCCNPLNNCTCRMPLRKCSYCGMSVDICNCHRRNLWDDKNTEIRNKSWQPRISGHFSRGLRKNPDNCHCDKTRPYGSDELPYQKLNVFSNVMTELQQKISDSTYCPRCNNAFCCCPKSPKCLSAITERPNSARGNESPPQSCKCSRMKKTTFTICDVCQTSPCRCRRDKRPQAKCFYCKTMPCRCNWTNDNKQKGQSLEEKWPVGKIRPRLCQCPLKTRENYFVNRRRNQYENWID